MPEPEAPARDPLVPLREAIRHIAIPSAPPQSDPYREALGLNLLALALRLDHVDRLSESLRLADSTHMVRTVSVDVNLAALTAEQVTALDPSPHERRQSSVWLPIARHARSNQAPIVVRDSAGSVLTTSTHRETMLALSQGLRRTFMIWLDSNPDAHRENHPLYDIRHRYSRSTWLIEAALTTVIENGAGNHFPHERRSQQPAGGQDEIRGRAEKAVELLFANTDSDPFLRLLEIASSEHLLVVRLDTEPERAYLHYDAPVLSPWDRKRTRDRQARRPEWQARLRRMLRPPPWALLEHEFTITYETVIPRAVNSYHVTVEVPEEIRVRRLMMTSDNEADEVGRLVSDMTAVADRYEELRAAAPQLLELELQSIVSRVAELGRRRRQDLGSYQAYIDRILQPHRRFRRPPKAPVDVADMFRLLGSDRRSVRRLAQLAELYDADRLRTLTGVLDREVLRTWAARLEAAELQLDLYVDNDPREHAGHTQWSRRTFGGRYRSTGPVQATVYAVLVDDPPSLAASVGRLLLAVVALVLGLTVLLGIGPGELWAALPDHWPDWPDTPVPSEARPTVDAVATVLLLVPGLLLSRLDIPSHQTVLGRLRLFSRYVAYTAVTVSVGLALTLATRPASESAVPLAVSLFFLVLLVAVVLVDGAIKAYKRRTRVPNKEAIPRWLIDELRRHRRQRRWRSTVTFSTVRDSSDV